MAVAFIGKIKTVSQMVAIPLLLYHDPLGAFDPHALGHLADLHRGACSRLISMVYYLKMALPQSREHE